MLLRHHNRHKVIQLSTTLFFVLSITYFSYHAINGEKGLLTMLKLSKTLEKIEAENAVIKEEREALELKVSKLYPESLDPDLLDEQARRILGYSKPGEIVYIIPEKERKELKN